jgi:hypothetical protein
VIARAFGASCKQVLDGVGIRSELDVAPARLGEVRLENLDERARLQRLRA